MDWYNLVNQSAFIIGAVSAIVLIYRNWAAEKQPDVKKQYQEEGPWHRICLLFLVILFFATRLYRLDEIPLGFHVDEAAMSYNAFSLAHYGVDRYLDAYPVVVNNFGSGQSALYTYVLAFLLKIFDYSLFLVRLPAVFFGGLTALFTYLLVKKAWGSKAALFAFFLVDICPYFLMSSRWGLDCNLYLGAFAGALYVFVAAIEKQDKKWYALSGIAFGLVLYTYSLSYLTVPFFLFFSILYLLWIRRIQVGDFMCLAVPLFVLALPLMLFVIVNAGWLEEIATGLFTIPKFSFYRISELSASYIPGNLNILKLLLIEDGLNYNAVKTYGTLYYISIPFVFSGFLITIRRMWSAFKKKEICVDFFVVLLFISIIVCSMAVYKTNINRSNAVFFPLVYFITASIKELFDKYWRTGLVAAGLYALCSVFFMSYYFTDYGQPPYTLLYFDDGIYGNMELVNSLAPEHSRPVYIDPTDIPMAHIYTVIYELMSPYDFIPEADEKKNMSYWNYCFYLPEEIDRGGIYMIHENKSTSYQELLRIAGFTETEQNHYRIFTMEGQ